MEEDHSLLFLKKNLMKIFFFFLGLSNFFFFEKFGNLKFLFFDFLFFVFCFCFLKELKTLIGDFFFFNLEILNFFKELKILIDVFFFKQPKKYEPNAPSPKALY